MRSVVSFRASGQSVASVVSTDWPEAHKRDNRSHTPLETIDCSTTMSLYRLTCRTKSLPMRDVHLPGSVTWKRAPNSASLLVISVSRRDWCPTPFKSYKATQVRSPYERTVSNIATSMNDRCRLVLLISSAFISVIGKFSD